MEVPDILQQHGPGYDAIGIAEHIFQQLEFLRLQIDGLAAARHSAFQKVHFQIGNTQGGQLLGRRGTPCQRCDSCKQFGEGKWLDQIVVAASIKPFDAIVYAAESSQKQDRSEERSVGNEGVSTLRYRWLAY